MDAPPAVCNRGGVHLCVVWRRICPGARSSSGTGTSNHPLHRRAVRRARNGQQGTDSGAHAHKGGPALFQPGGRGGYRDALQDRLRSERSHFCSAARRWREGARGGAEACPCARVVFTVTEGERGAVSQIHFEGNAHFSEKVLRKQMKTRGKTLIYFVDKSGRLDEVQLEQDMDKLREFYQNHGYIDVEIKNVRKERTEKGPMIIT